MIKSFLKFSGIALAGIIVLLICVYLFLMKTSAGQNYVLDTAKPYLESNLGLVVEAEKIGGSWPAKIRVQNIVLKDTEGVWFRADQLVLDWKPLDLLGNAVTVNLLSGKSVDVIRQPVLKSQPSEDEPDKQGGSIPEVTIKQAELESLRLGEALLGTAFEINGKLGTEINRGAISANLDLVAHGKSSTRLKGEFGWSRTADALTSRFKPIRGTGRFNCRTCWIGF